MDLSGRVRPGAIHSPGEFQHVATFIGQDYQKPNFAFVQDEDGDSESVQFKQIHPTEINETTDQ